MTPSLKYDPQYAAAAAKGIQAGAFLAACVDVEGDRALHEIHRAAVRYTRGLAIGNAEQIFFLIRGFKAAANITYIESKAKA